MKKNQTIGITGGTGYIGTSLSKFLSEHFDIKLLDVKPTEYELPAGVSYQFCDIRNYESLEKALTNVDLVIHSAIIEIPKINEDKKKGFEVNVIGSENVCRAVDKSHLTKGLILTGTWHTIGDVELKGLVNETFGYRTDKVEERARFYALTKTAQASIVELYNEMSEKFFGVLRMGTVLGEGMADETGAKIFISNGLSGKPITPFEHSMFRPMLFVDIKDVCVAFERFATRILEGKAVKSKDSMNTINLFYPEAFTVLELAQMIKEIIVEQSNGKIQPEIAALGTNKPVLYFKEDKKLIYVDVRKADEQLGMPYFKNPRESIERIIKSIINQHTKT